MSIEVTTLRLTTSETPVVRAGANNMVWPFIAIALVMLGFTRELPINGKLVFGTFLIATILIGCRLFYRTVAKVTFHEDNVDVMLAISERKHRYSDVELVTLVRLKLAPLLRIQVKTKGRVFHQQYEIRGPLTRWGTLKESSSKLREHFETRGVKVVER